MTNADYEVLAAKIDRLTELVETTKEVLDIEECARMIGISVSTLYSMTSKREITFYKPKGKKIFFKRSEVEQWLLTCRYASNDEIDSQAATYCATHDLKTKTA